MPVWDVGTWELGWLTTIDHDPAPGVGAFYEEKSMVDHTPEQLAEMDRDASHIAYAISTAIVNSKFNDQERTLVQRLVTEAAQHLTIKMTLLLPPGGDGRPRFNIAGYVKTSNQGQRKMVLSEEETVG